MQYSLFSSPSSSPSSSPLVAQTQTASTGSADVGWNDLQLWQGGAGLLILALVGTTVFHQLQLRKVRKDLRFQTFKSTEMEKKLRLALRTIAKMETNPDLVHSRDFNLDYLRMRMEEKNFNFAILNQIKAKINIQVRSALRPTQADTGTVGVASTTARALQETIEVEYDSEGRSTSKRVLFRIQIRLVRFPAQKTSETIQQLVECMEAYLSPDAEEEFWYPTIQGHLATLQWDQKAKPTPLLVLEQSAEGSNVTIRSQRGINKGRGASQSASVKAT
ncbi:hypothetical protein PROH_21295 [Prochlorothrix hollandica PCC 9006 = CALU 1027]|uniref:Uncharacterized protein n=1 Tax=Prochlorothrix hollandica PCC 9006 = CALU 1027 TaxID=317619 RepID=A0A0M2PV12_PROHO|nr:hypothetical protein PROH_21295 [Prochlorothrix hollandica PCC 9006 = CALU 1027]